MARTTKAAPVDLAAIIAAVMAAQGAPAKAVTKTQPQLQAAKVAEVTAEHPVVAALKSGGASVHRTGKAGTTSSGRPRIWVDASVGGCRISGNAYLK